MGGENIFPVFGWHTDSDGKNQDTGLAKHYATAQLFLELWVTEREKSFLEAYTTPQEARGGFAPFCPKAN